MRSSAIGFVRWGVRRIPTWLGELLLSRRGPAAPRAASAAALLTLAVAAALVALNWDGFRRHRAPLVYEQHGLIALEMAIHRHRFGAVSHIYRKPPPAAPGTAPGQIACVLTRVPNDAAMLSRRLRDLPESFNPSTQDYARHLEPYLNNENSLMLLDSAVLAVLPDITLAGMVRAHVVLKAACLVVFAFCLLRVGFSPLFTLGGCHVAFVLVRDVTQARPVGLYPWLLPVLLLLVSLLGLCLSFGLHRRPGRHLAAMLAVGFVGAFLVNLRSSYAPVLAALVLLYALATGRDLWRAAGLSLRRTALLTAAALTAFAAGYEAFALGLISPITAAARGSVASVQADYAHHVIAHPLVVFLAVPPNELARREGIEYDDDCAFRLARRVDPTVGYLRGNYDAALFTYYRRLWREHPREMLGVYRGKFRLAAATASRPYTSSGEDLPWACRVLVLPLRAVAQWPLYLVLFAGLAVGPVLLAGRLTLGRAFTLSALAAAGLLLFLEAGLLTSRCSLIYNSYLCFWLLAVGLLGYQGILDGAAAAVRRPAGRPRAALGGGRAGPEVPAGGRPRWGEQAA
jgi:hypothetical protein